MWHVYFRRFALSVFAVCIVILLSFCLVALNTQTEQSNTQRVALQFPFLIDGTDLIAEYFLSYEGDYFEDQSGDFVMDCGGLCVYNRSDTQITFASLNIETLDGLYTFEGTCIPPHTKVVMLEKYKSANPESGAYFAAGKTVCTTKTNVVNALQLEVIAVGCMKVTNISASPLSNITLYYKRYDSQWDIYIGGVTYAISAGDLQPGESILVFPDNYAKGYSKVLYATAE